LTSERVTRGVPQWPHSGIGATVNAGPVLLAIASAAACTQSLHAGSSRRAIPLAYGVMSRTEQG